MLIFVARASRRPHFESVQDAQPAHSQLASDRIR
jgi:hypothetical protein